MTQSARSLLAPLSAQERVLYEALHDRVRGRHIPSFSLIDAAVLLDGLAQSKRFLPGVSWRNRDALQAILDRLGLSSVTGDDAFAKVLTKVDHHFMRACRATIRIHRRSAAKIADENARAQNIPERYWWNYPYATIVQMHHERLDRHSA